MVFTPDVIIIGAGAAGLAAASKLTHAGINVHILEARDRIGGRIRTIKESGIAIELGAEFVHGKPREIWDLLGGSTEQVDEVGGPNWCIRDGQAGPCDFFDQVFEFLNRMKESTPDRSFAEWAATQKDVPESVLRRAFGYVEGFNAAHAEEISVNALVRASKAEEKIDGDHVFRIRGGYDFVPRTLLGMCDPEHLRISMTTVVESVEWKKGSVSVHTRPGATGLQNKAGMPTSFIAPKAVVTLPLGILRSNAVEFRPPLASKRDALAKLAVGHVIRVTLKFKERFWDSLEMQGKTLVNMRFLFTEDTWYPTWWSTMPQPAPVLVAWAPATCAERMAGKGDSFQIDRALQSLSESLPISRSRLNELLERGYVHDWQVDPFALGAYSYVCSGGDDAECQLAESLEGTLFMAGEATDTTGNFGTVHGAIASGYRAADEIMAN